jgi:hypothetical protein
MFRANAPVFRSNPGFVGGGLTAGGAPEFVVPNGPIPWERLRSFLAHLERMKLQPHETELVGKWVTEDGQVRADATFDRINWLTFHHLREISVSKQWGSWETLFRDPDDGRYWEKTYPHGEMQGGGPSALKVLTRKQAKMKYGDVVP